jgi:uncharacterized protein (DUF952 family)
MLMTPDLTTCFNAGIWFAMQIYKILRADEWATLCANGQTQGAPIDVADGYVHLSTGTQVAETVSKHFGQEDGLSILALDSDALGEDLKWEPSRGGALFPHLYRDLRLSDVIWQTDLPLGENGHVFPEGVLPE